MKILSSEQIRAVDAATSEREPIQSIDLMERAAKACTARLRMRMNPQRPVAIYCGTGNNGGDGLAIARMLIGDGFSVRVYLVHHSEKFSEDCRKNFEKLKSMNADIVVVRESGSLADNRDCTLAIDALIGTGVHKPAEGLLAATIDFVNKRYPEIVSIDV